MIKEGLTEKSWLKYLAPEFEEPYMKELLQFIEGEYKNNKKIFPPRGEIFSALNLTPLPRVKIVILGQDPYHREGQAHGLSFSVKDGVAFPPSLRNIFTELEKSAKIKAPQSGSLISWATQGVLLLNAVLTVEEGLPNSHQKKGWEKFTDRIIETVNSEREGVVYVLWGAYAQKKASFIDENKNLVLKSVHPSPLSSHRGFFGSDPFSKANTYLQEKGETPISWALT